MKHFTAVILISTSFNTYASKDCRALVSTDDGLTLASLQTGHGGAAISPTGLRFLMLIDLALNQPLLSNDSENEGIRLAAASDTPVNPFLNMTSTLGRTLSLQAEHIVHRLDSDWPGIRQELSRRYIAMETAQARSVEDSDRSRNIHAVEKIRMENPLRGSRRGLLYLGGLENGEIYYLAWISDAKGDSKYSVRKTNLFGANHEIAKFEFDAAPITANFKEFIFISFNRRVLVINTLSGTLKDLTLRPSQGLTLGVQNAWFSQLGNDRFVAFLLYDYYDFDAHAGNFHQGQPLTSQSDLHSPRAQPVAMGRWIQFVDSSMDLSNDDRFFDGVRVLNLMAGAEGVYAAKTETSGVESLLLTNYRAEGGSIQRQITDWTGGKSFLFPVFGSDRLLLISVRGKLIVAAWVVEPATLQTVRIDFNPDNLDASTTTFEIGLNASGELFLRSYDRASFRFCSWTLDLDLGAFTTPERFDFRDKVFSSSATIQEIEDFDEVAKGVGTKLIFDGSGRRVLGIQSKDVIRIYLTKELVRNQP